MEYRRITATGLTVSKLCLGTMTFGGQVGKEESIRMTHFALDEGVNFVDTANVYQDGVSEEIVAKALEGRRDSVILATKVGLTRHPDRLNSDGLNRRTVRREVELSLSRLATDYIDLYYLHTPNPDTPIEETVDVLDDLVGEGKIRYWGVSNFASWQLADADWTAVNRHRARPIMSQNVYNLLCRSVEPELVPCLTAHRIGMTVFNPLAGGLLSGKYTSRQTLTGARFDRDQAYRDRYWNEDSFRGVELLGEAAAAAGLSLAQMSIQWCAQHPFVDSVLVGATSMAHLEANLHALDTEPLTGETMARCDEVWKEISGTRYQYNR